MRQQKEAYALLAERLDRLRSLSWDELDTYEERREQVVGIAERSYSVVTYAFWDMDPWASGMYVIAKARPKNGLRRLRAYKQSDVLIVPAELHRDAQRTQQP